MALTSTVTPVLVSATALFTGGQQFDLIDLVSVKLELQITDTLNDAWLAQLITRQSITIKNYCNRVFQPQVYQDQIWPFRDPYLWQVQGTLARLQLAYWPLTASPSTAATPPPLPAVLSPVTGSAPGTYYVRISYVTPTGETPGSLETTLTVGSGQTLSVASPLLDKNNIATGWNCYIGATSQKETLQNTSPIAIGTSFPVPNTGLIAGSATPDYVLAVADTGPESIERPLAEGLDFTVDAMTAQITRLNVDGWGRTWDSVPLIFQYQAGYAAIPPDVQDCIIDLVKMRWFARQRDPMVRSENVEGVYQAQYWFGTGPGTPGDLPAYVANKLDRYRVPVNA
jgi:hypothetical protein